MKKKRDPERFSNLPEVAQLVNGRAHLHKHEHQQLDARAPAVTTPLGLMNCYSSKGLEKSSSLVVCLMWFLGS